VTENRGADYIGIRTICEKYRISAEVIAQNVKDGLLNVFATSGGQQWFRVSDVEAVFGTLNTTTTEQEQ
jgi:predicted site-specific integrase-resolvase